LAARVATAALLIAALLAALFLLPRPWFAAIGLLLSAAAAVEWARLCRMAGAAVWLYAGGMAFAFGVLYNTEPREPTFMLAALFWIVVAPLWLWRGMQRRWLDLAGFVVILPAALALVILRPLEVLLVLLLVWIADIAAYFVGRAWGRRKLAPGISPGKTWEGAIGGTVAALVYAIICGTFFEGILWVPYLLAAVLLAVLSIVGDLFESAAKRQAAVKDSGNLLPGHGGVLDRIDSATAALPAAALLLPYLRAVT
jgi:phosphatidate cytidylyltransferase